MRSSPRHTPRCKSEKHTGHILVVGARANNLRDVSLRVPLNRLTVVTGRSGAGKSSLVFDTIHAEGQRRYVATFSAYARQFLDRMDRPPVDRIEGLPPAVAIRQVNPVRTSRSTVGTMTEINDHLKLVYSRFARLFCDGCGREVRRETPGLVLDELFGTPAWNGKTVSIGFFPPPFSDGGEMAMRSRLQSLGFRHVRKDGEGRLVVAQDRIRIAPAQRARIMEALESSFRHGAGRIWVDPEGGYHPALLFSRELHCAVCDQSFRDPSPNLFSFNSPVGACARCRGFGRVIGIDPARVVPDESLSLRGGAIRPWQGSAYRECQCDLLRFARQRDVPLDVPWRDLSPEQRRWVFEGEGAWEDGRWYGIHRFFDWLEGKAYRMHIRVLLSKYREYRVCPDCGGARLRPEALRWKLTAGSEALSIDKLACRPLSEVSPFLNSVRKSLAGNVAAEMVLDAARKRLGYLLEVGLDYLTLDRQSRTLSGGEAQRINLTTALGSSLVNTLFVLDEPSIGMHARDIDRLTGILRRLRDAGNTLLLVEHDPRIIAAADQIIELGPGAGSEGGEVVFSGSPCELAAASTETARGMAGEFEVQPHSLPAPTAQTPVLRVSGASENNLEDLDVDVPLDRLVVLSGVSGSGKSSLLDNVLYRGLLRRRGEAVESVGACRSIEGGEALAGVDLVDQSAIGKSARGNPASYIGALTPIRKLLAATSAAREAGLSPGAFSFNSPAGRCPVCGGSGFEHVEMQFLSDVYLRCPACGGSRFRPESLEARLSLPGFGELNIAEILELTVDEACEAFAGTPAVTRTLAPLRAVGLGYPRLGQPTPTLSGGEAQRLKLAGVLARGIGKNKSGGRRLLLLDEPTTGLHMREVSVLLQALRRLIAAGHAVVVIEHNLEVIAAADWIVDLGPEGGERGGKIVFQGTPAEVSAAKGSRTGRALREKSAAARVSMARDRASSGDRPDAAPPPETPPLISIRGARPHNLQGINLDLPRDRLIVVTGVSGSGKSTLAFDILFAEGQRRYLECLNAYARQFVQPAAKPEIDSLSGLPPSVAIEQRLSRGGHKSTVATITEIHHFLRLIFTRLGEFSCEKCGGKIDQRDPARLVESILRRFRSRTVEISAPLVSGRKGYYNELAAWALRKGWERLRVDGDLRPTDGWRPLDRYREHDIELPVARLKVSTCGRKKLLQAIHDALEYGKDRAIVRELGSGGKARGNVAVYSTRRACSRCGLAMPDPDPRLFSFNSPHGWCPACQGRGVSGEPGEGAEARDEAQPCAVCGGARLRPAALAVRFHGLGIADMNAWSIETAEKFFLAPRLNEREAAIGRDIVAEIRVRLEFLRSVGLGYLTLGRSAPTLSGGEAQRIRLAAQLGADLRGVCYVLDEPTIGLHPCDNERLLATLRELKTAGNTVVVVEHDEATIRAADHVVDLGPGAGENGGKVVAEGTPEQIMDHAGSVTGRFLRHPLPHPLRPEGRRRFAPARDAALGIEGATLHNLKNLTLQLPLRRLVVITGVSGSGKSTLAREVVFRNLRLRVSRPRARFDDWYACRRIEGWQQVRRVVEVDQSPIGRTPRSCPATYTGIWTFIRNLFAAAPEARLRGFDASRFSFNTREGRCPVCEGQGQVKLEMNFLPDVTQRCDQCQGRRFTPETLAVTFNGRSIADVLEMSVAEAAGFFSAQPPVKRVLDLMHEVGLDYLRLGQQSSTLSGGEAQRLKLVSELANYTALDPGADAQPTLYLLDEPTVGLHMADVERLLRVLHRLVDAGHSVVVVEHNLDLVAEADWVIDMGPGGGDAGGRVVARGTPETLLRRRTSRTGAVLKKVLEESD